MSDPLADTPSLAAYWCPTCAPDRDPTREILQTRYCPQHEIRTTGADDAAVGGDAYLSGSGEAGGDDNRRWNDLLRRGRT